MANLFELQATLSLNKDAYVRGLKEAQGDALGMGGKIVSALGNTAKLAAGKAADAAVNAVKNFASSSLSLSKDFNSSVSQIAATMGLNMQEFAKQTGEVDTAYGHFAGNLKEFAQYMGANTAFTATQASEALNYMALAGYNAQQSMEMLPNVLNLAAAGGMDLAMASDMVTDAQTAFGLSAWETQRMIDQMAVTASTTNTSVSQLGEAFLTVGAYGRQLSGGTAELSMLLGALADNGIKGAEGGTHLRNVIRALATPTDEAAKRLKKLGVSVYDSNGDLRDMTAIFSDLNDSMLGKTAEQRNEILSDIFNATDLAAINALLGTSSDRWQEILTAILGADGAAQEMADTQLDNLAGDITKLSSAFDGLRLIVGDSMEQTLRPFVQTLTNGVGRITTALQEEGLAGAFREAKKLLADLYGQAVQSLKESDNAGIRQIGEWAEGLPTKLKGVIEKIEEVATSIGKIGKAFSEDGIEAAAKAAAEQLGLLWTEAKQSLSESDSAGLQQIASLMGKIEEALLWIQNNQSTVVTAIETIIAAFAVEKVFEFAAHIKTIADTIGAISLNPLILGALVLGAAIIDIKNNWEGIKEAATGAWETVKTSWGNAKQWFNDNISQPIKEFTDAPAEKKIKIMQDAAENLGKIIAEIGEWLAQPITKTIQLFASWGNSHDKMQAVMDAGVPPTIWNSGTTTTTTGTGTSGTHPGTGTRTRNPSGTAAGPKSKAMGMSYVPWDGYLISAHRGEALLNRDQAHDWRGNAGSIDTQSIADAVSGAIREAMANIGIMIDGQVAGTMMAGTVSRAIAGQVRRGRFN